MKFYKASILTLALCLCFGASKSIAQDYLITAKGDSLSGDLKPLLYGTEKSVQITEPGKKKVFFKLLQIREYRYKNDLYRPVKGPDGYTFMKLVKDGYLSLYTFQASNQSSFDSYFLLKKDGNGIEVPNLGFEKSMRKFLYNCPTLTDKIERDELNKKDLNLIIDSYNDCMASNAEAPKRVPQKIAENKKSADAWNELERKVNAEADFEGKQNALEMITEVKSKISSGQKVPNFLIAGLRNALSAETFKETLETAVGTLEQ